MENVKLTGEGREINRHNFKLEEIDVAMQKPVVQRLLKLIRFRNEFPAFNGEFKVMDSMDNELKLSWQKTDAVCKLNVNLDSYISTITFQDEANEQQTYVI